MRLYSERYKDIGNFQLWTYAEVKIVENGYTESDDQNTINILQSRKWGFVEVEESEEPVTPDEATEEVIESLEEPPEKLKEKVKKGQSAKKRKVTISKKAKNSALGMDDVDALTGGRH